MGIDAVVFDIGNVLIEWNPERFYDRVVGPDRRAALFAATDLHAMNDRIDRGEEFRAVVYDHAECHGAYRDDVRLWHDRWTELAGPEIAGSVRLLEALKARGVRVLALSNFGVGTFEAARQVWPFLDRFDRAFLSGRLRTAKPDPEIYRIVERDGGVKPGRLFFTDDRAENIAVAAARGWQTHLFDGPRGLARRLFAEGLIDERDAA